MPSQTFFNLTDEKKQRIIEALTDEFAVYSFNSASIARIIEKADIPRGSFYQYFTDIKDAYKYLLDVTVDKKIQYFQRFMADFQELDAFEMIKRLYTEGLRFAHEEPKLTAIGNLFLKESEGFKREIFGEFEERSTQFFQGILQRGQAKGEISQEIDTEVASFIFSTLNLAITDYYLMKSKQGNYLEHVEDYLEIVNKMLFILGNGIKSPSSKHKEA